jgi:hypothetical protein
VLNRTSPLFKDNTSLLLARARIVSRACIDLNPDRQSVGIGIQKEVKATRFIPN